MTTLVGKRIIIAGGATGIGAAAAERAAREGASVLIGDINLDRARQTAQGIVDAGGRALATRFDLADEASIDAMHRLAMTELGGIDGLFNVGADLRASGDLTEANPDRDGDLLDMPMHVWRQTFETNLTGYVLLCRAALPAMLEQGGGVIVNASSGAGSSAMPNRPAYAASKAGVESITRHIAARWGKQGIRCNAVAPGMVLGETQLRDGDTALHEMALQFARSPRLGRPADIAAAVAYLLSDDAEWINGQVWHIDGGMGL